MPLIRKETIDQHTILCVWRCSESIEELQPKAVLDDEDLERLNGFLNLKRRIHFLTVRIMCKEVTGSSKILYNQEGKPTLDQKDCQISISHSHDFVAVLFGDTSKIGIDIQRIDPKVLRIQDRFMNPHEKQLIEVNNIEQLTIFWSAKESIYKIHGDPSVFFLQHIEIHVDQGFQSPNLTARINHQLYSEIHHLKFEILENYVLVYTVVE